MKTLFLLLVLAIAFTSPAQAQSTQLVIDQATVLPSLATPGSGTLWELAEYTDAQGNTFQAGTFRTVHFGPFSFTSPDAEVVVAKRNAAGVYQWALHRRRSRRAALQGLGRRCGWHRVPDGFLPHRYGHVWHHGAHQPAGGESSTNDVFVCKVTAAGAWDWAVSAGGGTRINGNDYATALAVDALGDVYVGGTFTSSVAFFGSIQVPSPDPNGRPIAFVAKLFANGQWGWVRNNAHFGGSVTSLTTDAVGNAYLSGHFLGRVHYGPFLVTASNGSQTAYTAKVDASGTWQWATAIQAGVLTNGNCQRFRVVLDGQGSAYATGVFTCDTLNSEARP